MYREETAVLAALYSEAGGYFASAALANTSNEAHTAYRIILALLEPIYSFLAHKVHNRWLVFCPCCLKDVNIVSELPRSDSRWRASVLDGGWLSPQVRLSRSLGIRFTSACLPPSLNSTLIYKQQNGSQESKEFTPSHS